MTEYIWMLTSDEQAEILTALCLAGIEGEDLELAMNGRVCDLENTIDISDWR